MSIFNELFSDKQKCSELKKGNSSSISFVFFSKDFVQNNKKMLLKVKVRTNIKL